MDGEGTTPTELRSGVVESEPVETKGERPNVQILC